MAGLKRQTQQETKSTNTECTAFKGWNQYPTFRLRVGEQGLGLGIYDPVTWKNSKKKTIYLEPHLTGAGLPSQRYLGCFQSIVMKMLWVWFSPLLSQRCSVPVYVFADLAFAGHLCLSSKYRASLSG